MRNSRFRLTNHPIEMNVIEEITVPLLSSEPNERNKITTWHVKSGQHVTVGEPIFDIETSEQVYSIESQFSGFITIAQSEGSTHEIGDVLGTILCDVDPEGYRTIGIELSEDIVAIVDSHRGQLTRRDFLSKIVTKNLQELGATCRNRTQ